MAVPHEFCDEHSGIKALLKTLLGLVGTAVVLLLFQVGLTLNMGTSIRAELADRFTTIQNDMSTIRERVAVLESKVPRDNGYTNGNHPGRVP